MWPLLKYELLTFQGTLRTKESGRRRSVLPSQTGVSWCGCLPSQVLVNRVGCVRHGSLQNDSCETFSRCLSVSCHTHPCTSSLAFPFTPPPASPGNLFKSTQQSSQEKINPYQHCVSLLPLVGGKKKEEQYKASSNIHWESS